MIPSSAPIRIDPSRRGSVILPRFGEGVTPTGVTDGVRPLGRPTRRPKGDTLPASGREILTVDRRPELPEMYINENPLIAGSDTTHA